MKVSKSWIQTYFDEPLPDDEALVDALTFHAFEIEEQQGDMLDLKVLADRAAYGLSHRGVALEVGAALDMTLVHDPLAEPLPEFTSTKELFVEVDDSERCARYMGALVRGVSVGPSPEWLSRALESVGQRSINNVVDATNYVMLNIGQPLHAFDARKLASPEGMYGIRVRASEAGEMITTLGGEERTLPEGILLITDAYTHAALGIAGVKGGVMAEVDSGTTDIIIEAATFAGPDIRHASQKLKLWTDASLRFQNAISPQLAAYGMRDVLTLIQEIAGGTVVGVTEVARSAYADTHLAPIEVSLQKIRSVLGLTLDADEVGSALDRLLIPFTEEDGTFVVMPPFWRKDLRIPEDVIEEVGRTVGYDTVPSVSLPTLSEHPDQRRYRGIERIKDVLVAHGFSEVSTQTFAAEGAVELANPLDMSKPYLRTTLLENLDAALAHAVTVAPRTLGPTSSVRLFEIGSVFTSAKDEQLVLALGVSPITKEKGSDSVVAQIVEVLREELGMALEPVHEGVRMCERVLSDDLLMVLGSDYVPAPVSYGAYVPFSAYPAALRDVAVWTPEGTQETQVSQTIVHAAGPLLARIDCFDRFEKEGRVSYAFRLVFEASDRTLSDVDLEPAMVRVHEALVACEGFTVR